MAHGPLYVSSVIFLNVLFLYVSLKHFIVSLFMLFYYLNVLYIKADLDSSLGVLPIAFSSGVLCWCVSAVSSIFEY